MQILIQKIGIAFVLALVILNMSGCASIYLASRDAARKERYLVSELGKSRAELEERWGKPVTYVENTDGTVTCSYEYDALTEAKMKPLDSVIPASGAQEFSLVVFTVIETFAFPYYVAKDLALRERYRAMVTYDQGNNAISDHHYPITVTDGWPAPPYPPYEVSPIVQARLAQFPPGKGILKFVIRSSNDTEQMHCTERFNLIHSLGAASVNDYILQAFNMELNAAGRYSPQVGIPFTATIGWLRPHSDESSEEEIWGYYMQFLSPDGRSVKVQTRFIHYLENSCEEFVKAFKLAVADTFENLVQTSEFCSFICNGDPRCPRSPESLLP